MNTLKMFENQKYVCAFHRDTVFKPIKSYLQSQNDLDAGYVAFWQWHDLFSFIYALLLFAGIIAILTFVFYGLFKVNIEFYKLQSSMLFSLRSTYKSLDPFLLFWKHRSAGLSFSKTSTGNQRLE